MDTRTCIVCGEPARSGEHVFPAALGGRRKNKGIYCETHNNKYSPLVDQISQQLSLFNAQLGVVPDRSDVETTVRMSDPGSNRNVRVSVTTSRFEKPEISTVETPDGEVWQASFGSHEEARAWMAKQEERGIKFTSTKFGKPQSYHLGEVHTQLTLSSRDEDLRPIAYIAQTFFAQEFPVLARTPGLRLIQDYTLHGTGEGFVRWHFDDPQPARPNHFEFGHRITVGIDASRSLAYARVSLFSMFEYDVALGKVATGLSQETTIDIDPLAPHPPHDLVKTSTSEPTIRIDFDTPQPLPDQNHLVSRMQAFLTKAAQRALLETSAQILEKITATANFSSAKRKDVIRQAIQTQSQRVLNVARWTAAQIKKDQSGSPELHLVGEFLSATFELDPKTSSGLSPQADAALQLTCAQIASHLESQLLCKTLSKHTIAEALEGKEASSLIVSALVPLILDRRPGT